MLSRFLAVLVLVVALASAADKPWLELHSAHFRAITSGGERPARRALAQFEQLRAALSGLGFNTDLGAPVVVVVAKEEPTRVLPGTERTFVILRDESAFGAAAHDYVHLVEARSFPPLPLWLHEGLSDYYTQPPAAMAPRLKVSPLLPLEALRAVDVSSSLYNEAGRSSLYYAECWALVQMLLNDPESKALLQRSLQALKTSATRQAAWNDVFGPGTAIETKFRAYIERGQFAAPPWLGRIPEEKGPAKELPAVSALALLRQPQEPDAHVARAEALLKQSGGLEEALSEARQAAELWPGSNERQLLLGRVLLAMRRSAEASTVARRVAADARSTSEYAAALDLSEQVRKQERAQGDQKQVAELARIEKQRVVLRDELAKKKRQPRRPLPAAFGLAEGTIASTGCRMPFTMDMEVKRAKDSVKLQALDLRSVDYNASGWEPPADFNACKDLKGRPARVYYSPVKGTAYAGEVLIVELTKPPAPPPAKKKAPPPAKKKTPPATKKAK